MEKTVCELFAGVGGFRLGLEASARGKGSEPWQTVFANQWEPSRKRQDAFDCYCAHFGYREEYTNVDIATVDKAGIPDHTLLCAGFPCQDYSVARTQAKGIEGKKGVLWWQVLETIKAKHPPFVLLENVDRLLKSPASQRGRDFGIILASLWYAGYAAEWRVVNAADYGFPQRRRRVFIFAMREGTRAEARLAAAGSREVMAGLGVFAQAFPCRLREKVPAPKALPIGDLAIVSDIFAFDFKTAGCMFDGLIYTADAEPDYHGRHLCLADVLDHPANPLCYQTGSLEKWQYLKGGKKLQRTAKNGHVYTYSEGPVPYPDPIERPARTILTSESAVSRTSHIIMDPDTHKMRLLSPEEAEALQGFPKGWTNTGMNLRSRYFCMGNALVTGCIQRIGSILNTIVAGE